MIKKPSPFKGLNTSTPTTIPLKERGVIHHGSGLVIMGIVGTYSHP